MRFTGDTRAEIEPAKIVVETAPQRRKMPRAALIIGFAVLAFVLWLVFATNFFEEMAAVIEDRILGQIM